MRRRSRCTRTRGPARSGVERIDHSGAAAARNRSAGARPGSASHSSPLPRPEASSPLCSPSVEAEYDDGAFESLIAPLAQSAQDALRLRFVDDLDYDRIAAELGTSPEAARQRVSTAVRTLRERVTA